MNKNQGELLFRSIFFLIYIISNSLFVIISTSSLRFSMIVVMIFVVFLITGINSEKLLRINKSYMFISILVFLAVIFHSIITGIFIDNYNITRAFLSLILLILMFTTAPLLANLFESIEKITFYKTIIQSYYCLLFIGFLSVILQKGNFLYGKEMLLFNEPSHYALVLLPLCLYYMILSKHNKKNYHLLVLTFLALLLENLTFIVGIIFILILVNWKYKYRIILFISGLLFFFSTFDFPSISYYSNRLLINKSSNNLSVLVFVSGWERAYDALIDTYGIGIGIQNLGYAGNIGASMEKIGFLLNGTFINLYDGGTLAPKIIAEFGLIGVIALIYYIRTSYKLIKVLVTKNNDDLISVFFVSIFLMFNVQLFVRGVGYFSPMSYMFATAAYVIFVEKILTGKLEIN